MSVNFTAASLEQVHYGTTFDPTPNADEFTIMCWFKIVNDTQGMIFTKSDAAGSNRQFFIFYQSTSKKIGIRCGGGTGLILSTTLVNDSAWHHAALRNINNAPFEYEIWLDGVNENSGTTGAETSAADVRLATRGNSPTFDNYFDNPIDDARAYDRALTDDEIRTIYNSRGSDSITDDLIIRAAIADGAPGTTAGLPDIASGLTPTVVGTPTNEESILTLGRRRVQVA